MSFPISDETVVAVVGLGYVGLPLAVEFGKKYRTIGFDLSEEKIANYRKFRDPMGEIGADDFRAAARLTVSTDPAALREADVIVVAVPTPIDDAHTPDFAPLIGASTAVAAHMKRGSIVVYESTVYPGATEEVCIPLLEKHSGMTWKQDFHVGYSPERVNPGDKERTVSRIVKVVSGDDEATLKTVAELYGSIIEAGICPVGSIKIAVAAKVIENTQRDLNIALMNELAIIFDKIGIDTLQVLEAAETKWNFLPFRPGLVGGHCIGVDPYYLTYKAEMMAYHPQVILAGRRINDGMGERVARDLIRGLLKRGVKDGVVTVLGLTFKENVPDTRNSKVVDIVRELQSYGLVVQVCDPRARADDAQHEYGITLTPLDSLQPADAVVLAVAHQEFVSGGWGLIKKLLGGDEGMVFDIKSALDRDKRPADIELWRL
jgi:UDP-N-acetyl-D-galactosamine dehydrogenase